MAAKAKVGTIVKLTNNYSVFVYALTPGGILAGAHGNTGAGNGANGQQVYYYPDTAIQAPKAAAGTFYNGPGQSVAVGQADGSLRLVYCQAGKPVKGSLKMEYDAEVYTERLEVS